MPFFLFRSPLDASGQPCSAKGFGKPLASRASEGSGKKMGQGRYVALKMWEGTTAGTWEAESDPGAVRPKRMKVGL